MGRGWEVLQGKMNTDTENHGDVDEERMVKTKLDDDRMGKWAEWLQPGKLI